MESRRWAIVMTAAAIGGGMSLAVGACGEDERGSVQIEGSTTGAGTSTTSTTGTSTTGTSTTPGTATSTTPTTPTTGTETVETTTTER
jgi:hypothetical protein